MLIIIFKATNKAISNQLIWDKAALSKGFYYLYGFYMQTILQCVLLSFNMIEILVCEGASKNINKIIEMKKIDR